MNAIQPRIGQGGTPVFVKGQYLCRVGFAYEVDGTPEFDIAYPESRVQSYEVVKTESGQIICYLIVLRPERKLALTDPSLN